MEKKGWQNASIVQLRLIPAGENVTVSFHQEKLEAPDMRAEAKAHWEHVLTAIGKLVDADS